MLRYVWSNFLPTPQPLGTSPSPSLKTCVFPARVRCGAPEKSLPSADSYSALVLQSPSEHERTKRVVKDFLEKDGPPLHEKLVEYASTRASFIEEWWTESYLSHSESVVLSLNPFFILEYVLAFYSTFAVDGSDGSADFARTLEQR